MTNSSSEEGKQAKAEAAETDAQKASEAAMQEEARLFQERYAQAQRAWADVVYGVAHVSQFRDETGPEDADRKITITISGRRSAASDFDRLLKENQTFLDSIKKGEEVDPSVYFTKRSALLKTGNKELIERLLMQREFPLKDVLKGMAEVAEKLWKDTWKDVKSVPMDDAPEAPVQPKAGEGEAW